MRLENCRAWPNFKHLITEEKVLKYKNLEDAKKHIKYSVKPDIMQYEVDGISLTLYYENGQLTHAVTQGSDGIGEDILNNALEIHGVKDNINNMSKVIIKGVLAISKDNFKKLKESGNNYANCRYAAAGIARRLDGFNSEYLDFLAVKMYNEDASGSFKLCDDVENIKNLGFNLVPNMLKNQPYSDELFKEKLTNIDFDYSVTGIIVKSKSYLFVMKLLSEPKTTKIVEYKWLLSDTNKLVPIAYFEPVEIDGSKIEKASLLCAGVFKKLDAPVGSIVEVTKADGILPHIERVVQRAEGTIEFPKECPKCGGKLSKYKNNILCANNNCKNMLFSKCVKFTKKLKVLRFNEIIIEGLIEKGLINKFSDLFKIEVEDLIGLKLVRGSVTNKQAITLLDNLHERIKHIDDKLFISLLDMYKISYNVIETIDKVAKENNSNLLEVIEQGNITILEKAVKPAKIETIMNYMTNNRNEYFELKNILLGEKYDR